MDRNTVLQILLQRPGTVARVTLFAGLRALLVQEPQV